MKPTLVNKGCGDRYQNLANAIIIQTAIDYKEAKRILKTNNRNKEAKATVREIIIFFKSDWFMVLTTVDPYFLIDSLNNEFK